MNLRRQLLLLPVVLMLLPPLVAAAPIEAGAQTGLRRFLTTSTPAPVLRVAGRSIPLQHDLAAFYRQRAYQPAWFTAGILSDQGRDLLEILRSATDEGLCPEDYHLVPIDALLEKTPGTALGDPPSFRLDLLLTDAFLRYASDLSGGRLDPNRALAAWHARPRTVAPGRLLRRALAAGTVRQVLHDLSPPHPGYARLREALAQYRAQWVRGDWPRIPAGTLLQPGTDDPRLPLLRARLQAGGDLEPPTAMGNRYDAATVAALKAFQERHGLKTDGVLGPNTLAALNVPLSQRIRQIELNLERWRWLPKDLGKRYLMVNVADFRLTLVENAKTVLSMPVVVGTRLRPTPVFSGRLRYLELSPYWNVPRTILEEDLLPKFRNDPGLLRRRHFEIVSWRGEGLVAPEKIDWQRVQAETFPGMLRQRPGPWNPLGRIKFMFPNRYAVYLHDTPNRGLFARNVRSFSSGCIRIARPFELASYLLADGRAPELRAVLADRLPPVPLRVDLADPLPVHILYWTTWVTADGRVHFRDDIYARDIALRIALRRTSTAPAAGTVAGRPAASPAENGG